MPQQAPTLNPIIPKHPPPSTLPPTLTSNNLIQRRLQHIPLDQHLRHIRQIAPHPPKDERVAIDAGRTMHEVRVQRQAGQHVRARDEILAGDGAEV